LFPSRPAKPQSPAVRNPAGKKLSFGVLFWIILHAGTLLALGLSIALGLPFPSVDTDLLGLLPRSSGTYAEADRLLAERNSRSFIILLGSADFYRAKETAEELHQRLKGSEFSPGEFSSANPKALFAELSLYADEALMADISAYLHEYRYALLDPQTAGLLAAGKAQAVADDALALAYGAMTFSSLDTLDSDPFMLAERELRHFTASAILSGSGFGMRDGVLSAEFEGRHYVLLRGMLSEPGASLSRGMPSGAGPAKHGGAKNGIEEIYRVSAALERTPDKAGAEPVSFVFSGFPFHSYESSTNAQKEVSVISAVTLILLILLFLRVFRSPLPALMIIFAAGASIVLGLSAAFLVFRTIHILTLVFGVSLIGFSVDYSIHFCIHRRRGLAGKDAVRSLCQGVSLSFASSLVCFLIFLFAPFGILRQFALFSAVGLFSSYVTVMYLFPNLGERKGRPMPPERAERAEQSGRKNRFALHLSPAVKRILLATLALAGLGLTVRSPPAVQNDIRGLYTITPELLESERIASSIMKTGSGGYYFLVSGSDLQELLEHEETFLALLAEQTETPFLAASLFVPSLKTQESRYRAAAALLPLAEAQYEALGFPPDNARLLAENYRTLNGHYVLPGDTGPGARIPAPVSQVLTALLIGKTGGRWYSAIMPLDSPGTDRAARSALLKSLAAPYEWAAFVNKTEDISAELDSLTKTMFLLLAAAYFVIVLGILVYYRNAAQAVSIAVIPVLVSLVSLGIHALLGVPLSFFTASGFILVLGLGLDYMFYLTEGKLLKGTAEAVILSYVTTAISFGALLFSSFVPVFRLALAVFPGLSAAFLCAMALKE
jgi:predicted exporter